MTLTPAEEIELDRLVREQADDLEWLQRVENTYPLATHVLWTAEHAACDQRRAVLGSMLAPTVAIVLGGWRSGKSEGLKQLTAACALGGDHPAVRGWLAVNDLPTTAIPDGPAQVYVIAQSSGDSIRYHRDDFDRLIGPFGTWFNRNGKGEALLQVQIPGSKAVGKIWFKSVDQGRRAMQGISIRRAFIDEEPLGPDGYGVYDELRARVADQSGSIGIAMVPMEGITWVHDRLVRDHEDDARVFELDSLDNPHLPSSFGNLFAGMDEDDVEVRRHGRFKPRTGAVFRMWAAGDGDRWGPGHMCDDFPIPAEWPRFRGADFGLVNPTCVLRGALGDDGTLYIYREYYVATDSSYTWQAKHVAQEDAGESFDMGWGDPAAEEARMKFAAEGIYLAPADNDIKSGIDRLKDRMRIRPDGRPRIKVFRSCVNTLREIPALQWDPKRTGEFPIKKDDHAFDALKYMDAGIEQWANL